MKEKNVGINKNIDKLKKYDSELKFHMQNNKAIIENDAIKMGLSDRTATTGCKFVEQ